jgi:hypothetical protein
VRSTERASDRSIPAAWARITGGLHPSCRLGTTRLWLCTIAILRWATDTKALRRASGFRGPKVFLEVAVFGEDVGERLVYHIVSGDVEERGVLVDLLGGSLVEADRSGNLMGLNDLKQRHIKLLFGWLVLLGIGSIVGNRTKRSIYKHALSIYR